MNTFSKLKYLVLTNKFNSSYARNIRSGRIVPFDESFYSRFDGMYFGGIPIYHYLQKLNMGKCFDTSAILGLAMGDNVKVCRCELKTMSSINNDSFDHGWVETEDKVYDTTWQIVADKDTYYSMFGVDTDTVSVRPAPVFFEDCKKMSDWHIRGKEYYENNYVPFANQNAYQVHHIAELYIRNPRTSPEDIVYYMQLRKDLPSLDKLVLCPPDIMASCYSLD